MRTRVPASRLQFLRRVSLFRGLSDAELARVDRLMDDVTIEPGHELVREGGVGHEAFVIVAGEADVTIGGQKVAVVGPGDVVGEMALVDQSRRNATVRARSPMQVLAIDPAGFGALLDEAGVSRQVLKTVVRRLRAAESPHR
jgi:CRP/FNR family cyclic AMP-dependent transcriptional regulator